MGSIVVTEKGETVVLEYAAAKPDRIRGLPWWRAILALTTINLLVSCPLFMLSVAKRYSELLDFLAYFRYMSIAGIALAGILIPLVRGRRMGLVVLLATNAVVLFLQQSWMPRY